MSLSGESFLSINEAFHHSAKRKDQAILRQEIDEQETYINILKISKTNLFSTI